MFISLAHLRIQVSFLRLYIHIHLVLRSTLLFINVNFLQYLSITTQLSFEFFKHLLIVIFCYICLFIRYSYIKKTNPKLKSWYSCFIRAPCKSILSRTVILRFLLNPSITSLKHFFGIYYLWILCTQFVHVGL